MIFLKNSVFGNTKAYTLLEMLLVLMIVSTIFFITVIKIDAFKTNNYLQKELEYLGLLVQSGQEKALMTNSKYTIKIIDNEVIYNFGKNQIKHKIDSKVKIITNFPNNEININENGHLSRGGTITYDLKNNERKIIFSIGNGRYRIEKIK